MSKYSIWSPQFIAILLYVAINYRNLYSFICNSYLNMLSSDKISTVKSNSRNSKSQNSNLQDKPDPKKRYLIMGKHQRQLQRDKVRQIQQSKRKIQQKVQKMHLINELSRKKKELQQLEKSQPELQQKQATAVYNAKVKKQKDQLKKAERQITAQEFGEISKDRYKLALQRLQKEKKEFNYKQKQAQQLRKAHSTTQQYTRKQAIKFNKSIQLKRQQKRKQEYSQQITRKSQMIYGLKQQGIGKNKNYTVSHKVIILANQTEYQNEAMIKAQYMEAMQKTLNSQKDRKEQINRRKALERGKTALAKMQKSRQFDQYCQDAAKTQVRYNLSRIQAGKKNQFTGLKPMTLSQMEMNKKLRGEEEFERQFFKGKKVEKVCQIASKHTIFESKMKTEGNAQAEDVKKNYLGNKYTRYGKQAQTRYLVQTNGQEQQLKDSIHTSIKANQQPNNSYSQSQDSFSAK